MLDSNIVRKIEDFVYGKPRSVQEIAQHLGKNWRTADRYVDEIEKEFGTLSSRVFRAGTRGALKIVFWSSIEKASHSVFQKMLEEEILRARKKEDFSAFDIFQHIPIKNKAAWSGKGVDETDAGRLNDFKELLLKAKKQILFFSGNLSFINFKDKQIDVFEILEGLVKKGVNMKILCRVDVAGKKNIERLLALNFKYGKQIIEIRHREQPLRAMIIDGELLDMKEIKEPTGRINELNRKLFLYYTIKDKEWSEWLSNIFWKIFSSSVGADKRLEELNRLNIKSQ
jgi:hypothetical protein